MSANKDIIKHLNGLLKSKLTGINQYFLHARMLKHQGAFNLADYEYKASIDAMKQADMLVEHILSLGGKPKLQELDKLAIGEESGSMFANDLVHAEYVQSQMKHIITISEDAEDFVTAGLVQKMLESQQQYITSLRSQMGVPEDDGSVIQAHFSEHSTR